MNILKFYKTLKGLFNPKECKALHMCDKPVVFKARDNDFWEFKKGWLPRSMLRVTRTIVLFYKASILKHFFLFKAMLNILRTYVLHNIWYV
mgnify:CR=1 FL=1